MRSIRVAAAFLLGFFGSDAFAQGLTITGAASTFAHPLYARWFSEYKKSQVDFLYQPIGSAAGIRKLEEGAVFFAATDAPLSSDGQALCADLGYAALPAKQRSLELSALSARRR